jgi:hypothetical protein
LASGLPSRIARRASPQGIQPGPKQKAISSSIASSCQKTLFFGLRARPALDPQERVSGQSGSFKMKIVIFGQYKSGTTACFLKMKNSLNVRCYELFEKNEYDDALNTEKLSVLAKVIVPPNCQQHAADTGYTGNPDGLMPVLEQKLATFGAFDKKIYLVRDPRDWIISAIMFLPQARPEIYMHETPFNALMDIVRKKESEPLSVSMLDILEGILPGLDIYKITAEFVSRQHKWLFDFEDAITRHVTWKYEDMISNINRDVEQYLGFKLSVENQGCSNYAHVARTKSSGNWKHWMTPKDVDFFRPLFGRYMERHGYDLNWDLSPAPAIDPQHGSKYVERTVQMKRSKLS